MLLPLSWVESPIPRMCWRLRESVFELPAPVSAMFQSRSEGLLIPGGRRQGPAYQPFRGGSLVYQVTTSNGRCDSADGRDCRAAVARRAGALAVTQDAQTDSPLADQDPRRPRVRPANGQAVSCKVAEPYQTGLRRRSRGHDPLLRPSELNAGRLLRRWRPIPGVNKQRA